VFMARKNPLQESILREWGLEVLGCEGVDPTQALTQFLNELRDSVQALGRA
jgi:hypothetical protein